MKLSACLVLALLLTACASQPQKNSMTIEYGKIEKKTQVTAATQRTGSLTGGYRGMLEDRTTPARRETSERNVQRARTSEEAYVYSVVTLAGKSLRIVTEKSFLERSDCVAVERGASINLRLVDDTLCYRNRENSAVLLSEVSAMQCSLAKKQLLIAQTDRQLSAANDQVGRLCQFNAPAGRSGN